MKKYIVVTADGIIHTVYADSAEAACVRFECCGRYPYQATDLIDPEGKRIKLKYGHVPMREQN